MSSELRCTVFTENIGIVKNKKKVGYTRPFPLKVSVKRKKRSSLFVIRPLIFSDALGFSLLGLYVDPVLYAFSRPHVTCPIYVGFRPTVLASSFCSPTPPTKF